MKVKLDEGAFLPVREHPTDAGLDIRSIQDAVVYSHDTFTVHTGVHIELPKNRAGLLVSKSGMNVNSGITSTGLIDEGYSGEILVPLHNHSDTHYYIHKGDKVSQLVIIHCDYDDLEVVDEIASGTRGSNGFGSTGK